MDNPFNPNKRLNDHRPLLSRDQAFSCGLSLQSNPITWLSIIDHIYHMTSPRTFTFVSHHQAVINYYYMTFLFTCPSITVTYPHRLVLSLDQTLYSIPTLSRDLAKQTIPITWPILKTLSHDQVLLHYIVIKHHRPTLSHDLVLQTNTFMRPNPIMWPSLTDHPYHVTYHHRQLILYICIRICEALGGLFLTVT